MSTAQQPAASPGTGSLTLQCQFCLTWNRVAAERVADRPKCGKCAKPMLLDRPFPLTEDAFARTIAESTLPVLVDFYADWCGPCKMMAPFIDELAREYQGRALIAKVDSDRAPRTSQQHDVRGLPTTVVFAGGREVARQVGAVGKAQLAGLLGKAL
jgi:thioredoxin 2